MAKLPASVQHWFLSSRPEPLPRWLDAFPSANFVAPSETLKLDIRRSLAWLEIFADSDVRLEISMFRQRNGDLPLVVICGTPTDDQAILCFSLGAKAYCNAHASVANLRSVADVVLQGGVWLGSSLLQRLISATGRSQSQSQSLSASALGSNLADLGLSEREREVALAVAQGASNKEIGRQLEITERTVKAHVGAVFEKLGVRDRLQLAILVNRASVA